MLTSLVNVVQSCFSERDQGEISGLSRSVSNLGSSLGVAIAGTVVVSSLFAGNEGYAAALIVLAVFGLAGLVAAFFCPPRPPQRPCRRTARWWNLAFRPARSAPTAGRPRKGFRSSDTSFVRWRTR